MFTRLSREKIVFSRLEKRVMDFNIDPVLHHWCDRAGATWSDVVAIEVELKRFLLLRGMYVKEEYQAIGPVSDLWRVFITHTKLYEDFCIEIFGSFIHHHPFTTDTGMSYPRSYEKFVSRYVDLFEQDPPQTVWPKPYGRVEDHPKALSEVDQFVVFNHRDTVGVGAFCSGIKRW